uniref:Uncharacterized protein n=1 Tax=viral metagenome TaxID=1070528 RepID=A0A6C0EA27_9ZZZZ
MDFTTYEQWHEFLTTSINGTLEDMNKFLNLEISEYDKVMERVAKLEKLIVKLHEKYRNKTYLMDEKYDFASLNNNDELKKKICHVCNAILNNSEVECDEETGKAIVSLIVYNTFGNHWGLRGFGMSHEEALLDRSFKILYDIKNIDKLNNQNLKSNPLFTKIFLKANEEDVYMWDDRYSQLLEMMNECDKIIDKNGVKYDELNMDNLTTFTDVELETAMAHNTKKWIECAAKIKLLL